MKRWLSLLLSTAMVATLSSSALASHPQPQYQVNFNGRSVVFDVLPEVNEGRTFVPFRAIFEKMGASIEYDGATRTITAERDNTTVQLTIGSNTAYVNGSATTLSAAPYIKDDRTLVPLRFVGEAFGAQVNFDPATTAISIIDNNWPRRGGTLHLALWNKPEGNFNPITYGDTYGANIVGMMYSNLWSFDDKLVPQPAMAESWEWSNDNTTLTFHLRDDLTFHDGTPLTAKDVVFTYKAIFHPKYVGPRNSGFEKIKGWEAYNKGMTGESSSNFESGYVTTDGIEGIYAPDDHTVVFELTAADAPFFINQILYPPVDSSRYSKIPVQDWGTARDPFNAFPNGNGPYKMKEYVEGQYAMLEAFDGYFNGRPYMDMVEWKVIDPNVAVGVAQRGDLDLAEFNANELSSYQSIGHMKVHEFPDFIYQMMVYNTQHPILGDKRIRQAINYAIDRRSLIDNLMEGHASSIYAPIHPLTWAFSDDVEQYNYDPAKANALLDEAGWMMGSDGVRAKNGQRLSLSLLYPGSGNQVRIRTAPVVQQWLKEVGIDIKLEPLDWPTLLKKTYTDHEYDMFFIGFTLAIDPDPTGIWDKASTAPDAFNASGWWTDYSEQLLLQGRATLDLAERIDIYSEWQKHWADESPAILFYAPNTLIATNSRLQNISPGPQGSFWNLDDLWLSQ